MRLLSVLLLLLNFETKASDKDSTTYYNLPDSIKAVSFIADVIIDATGKKEVYAGLGTKHVKLLLNNEKNKRNISFKFPATAQVIARGFQINMKKDELEWKFNWQLNTPYKLMIVSATDTVENFVIYTGYFYLPLEQKWKLIGTCRIKGETGAITNTVAIQSTGKKSKIGARFSNVMVQRAAGTWKRLDDNLQPLPSPPVPYLSNIDSVEQVKADIDFIEMATSLGATNAKQNIQGVYYNIIDPGDGKNFSVNDSITVRYQLRIFGTKDVISGSETESFTFMLKNLIKAWQIAVPLIKTGGRIKLVIPSGLAYSIRTRAPKIPPNSILEFDVEVLDAK